MADMADIDAPPSSAKKDSDDEKEAIPDPPPTGSPWKLYLKNQWISILLSKNKLIYGFYTGMWYIL